MRSIGSFGLVVGRADSIIFEIRLDNEVIVLRGTESEASSQLLKGVLVLSLPASLKVQGIYLKMTGHLRSGFSIRGPRTSGWSNHLGSKTNEIFHHEWSPFAIDGVSDPSSQNTVLPCGNHEWPFELVINGSLPESIEGLAEASLTYKLKATLVRGKLIHDLHTWKPVRIVRTLDPTALELYHTVTMEGIWLNKIEYSIVIPQKAVIFGAAIPIDMKFKFLLNGLRIGTIDCLLLETHELAVPSFVTKAETIWRQSRTVEVWSFEVGEGGEMVDKNEPGSYAVRKIIPLPKELNKCLQDVDVCGIKIRHKLRLHLPVTIFMSPNIPRYPAGSLGRQSSHTCLSLGVIPDAAPLYGEHITDQLCEAVDQLSLVTEECYPRINVPSYNELQHNPFETHEFLSETNGSTSTGTHTSLSSIPQSREIMSQNISLSSAPYVNDITGHRSLSLAIDQYNREHIDYSDFDDLKRVPSYSTAIQSAVPSTSFSEAAPPNYAVTPLNTTMIMIDNSRYEEF
ncbi:hypothetical protein OIDMADRAFT_128584 [Oidiodendron maius Zn]|uniref:Arrestin C-terminal-like domain-containing protein n=1 Tax=Oidiodendron maius (strain Zn) TaxID=913774 RepID=A0A0C3H7N9_OIDMZ|nr:hypothetical protein OIDMADRAFT_128584 [Oidiodendron maius Zn]